MNNCYFCEDHVEYYESKGKKVIDSVLPDHGVRMPICRKCKKLLNNISVKERKEMSWDELKFKIIQMPSKRNLK